MRAIHLLLHAPEGENELIVIDLKAADENGNVQKAHNLKLDTTFRYTAASEYLIFGGVPCNVGLSSLSTYSANAHKAIISHIPLSRLRAAMPTTAGDEDPFRFELLQANETLSHARYAIKKTALPMTYSLGRAVGQLVGVLGIPSTHFESGVLHDSCICTILLTLGCTQAYGRLSKIINSIMLKVVKKGSLGLTTVRSELEQSKDTNPFNQQISRPETGSVQPKK